MSQSTINVLQIIWSSGHDFVYFGLYWLATHFRLVKKHRSLEERVADLERANSPEG